jgi:hypothetical protein
MITTGSGVKFVAPCMQSRLFIPSNAKAMPLILLSLKLWCNKVISDKLQGCSDFYFSLSLPSSKLTSLLSKHVDIVHFVLFSLRAKIGSKCFVQSPDS